MSAEDRLALDQLTTLRLRRCGAREDVISEGEVPRDVNLILSGWACRYKQLEDGRRQILAFFLPGDICDLNVYILREMDHSVAALTPLVVGELPRDALEEVMQRHPRIAKALWWETLVNAATQREWTVSLGKRSAFERMSHLFCELFFRLRAIGFTSESQCELPLTQAELADATGLSAVHVNRTLQELRGAGLIQLKDRVLRIPDLRALKEAALFNPNYLHLDHEGRGLDANRS
ncbi:Crp/Fnr family transcriptional regulator [Roseomonas elaeocarpi]|uniref:Crp/Fnr family transcriptional regulator n=1 Tax=Roseomonas elaeocarpi TaxID=907779 RepID=A0ABV6JT87_9PROT